jgi:hypothetical protein
MHWYVKELDDQDDRFKLVDDDASETPNVYCIYWWQALILLLGYVIYALVCAYYQRIMAAFCPMGLLSEAPVDSRPSVVKEPVENFRHHGENDAVTVQNASTGQLLLAALVPTHMRGKLLVELGHQDGDAVTSHKYGCYLFKRSRFYKYFSTAANAWRLRWFEFDSDGMRSFHDRQKRNKVHLYDLGRSQLEVVDESRLLFRLVMPSGTLYLQAPDQDILANVTEIVSRITPEIRKSQHIPASEQIAPLQGSV